MARPLSFECLVLSFEFARHGPRVTKRDQRIYASTLPRFYACGEIRDTAAAVGRRVCSTHHQQRGDGDFDDSGVVGGAVVGLRDQDAERGVVDALLDEAAKTPGVCEIDV